MCLEKVVSFCNLRETFVELPFEFVVFTCSRSYRISRNSAGSMFVTSENNFSNFTQTKQPPLSACSHVAMGEGLSLLRRYKSMVNNYVRYDRTCAFEKNVRDISVILYSYRFYKE